MTYIRPNIYTNKQTSPIFNCVTPVSVSLATLARQLFVIENRAKTQTLYPTAGLELQPYVISFHKDYDVVGPVPLERVTTVQFHRLIGGKLRCL